ncbi:hypothetical protein SAMN02745133_02856 [Desulforamulus putei DSM 12395]|uniref:Uncharacterized protein n=1 Tax=Desulforamulus putei DSM 12395 TaxID=1121429 RepID=A0A1M5C9L1_9FIRM|nr:hypothetical protein SAMN02745133_02856 [Desulforamulus putei DSM 12395]
MFNNGRRKERPTGKKRRSFQKPLMKESLIPSILSDFRPRVKGGRIWLKHLSRSKKRLN